MIMIAFGRLISQLGITRSLLYDTPLDVLSSQLDQSACITSNMVMNNGMSCI
jgi:hypothetical protein